MHRAFTYDIDRMRRDMAAKGWQPVDLARKCKPPVAPSTVMRFFNGEHQTARMAKRLSRALGKTADHYLVAAQAVA